jgi:hypothetical protein
MMDLAERLAVLDPDASAALQVVSYFDELTGRRAGLQAVVRGAAVLSGCTARLIDEQRHLMIRVDREGVIRPADTPPLDAWIHHAVAVDDTAQLWLEAPGHATEIQAIVMERAAAAARGLLSRTRSRLPERAASLEVLIDASVPASDRSLAAKRLGLSPAERYYVAAFGGGSFTVLPAGGHVDTDGRRVGVGRTTALDKLPASYESASRALRLTAEGSEEDPGPRVLRADELGVLLAVADLAEAIGPIDDVHALEHASALVSWTLITLDAVANTSSLRAAAATLHLHHSTLQERLNQIESLVGWSVRHPQGRFRTQLALLFRRVQRNSRV